MSLPGISCYCSTYGRPTHIIENSIACFLEQDWPGPKELVILNDFEEQQLIFKHPQVRIINLPERVKPLGKKFNLNVNLCQYDIIATWEDDDVFLKNRLSFSFNNMRNGLFHTHSAFHELENGEIIQIENIFHSTHMMHRRLFNEVGGYNEVDDTCAIDVELMDKLKAKHGDYTQTIPAEDIFYIYVWAGAQSYHGSGWGPANQQISDSAAKIVQQQISRGQVQTGRVELNPKLRYNFYEHLPILKL